jgi:phosphatidylserine/phosphatidylglycerophosphate/cardiolipin synthase-like enzyme
VVQYALAHDTISINDADAEMIHSATGLSIALANAVVAERQRAGRYVNLKDFERRVDGIGPQRAAECEPNLTFDEECSWRPKDLATDLRAILQRQPATTPQQKLAQALDEIATSAATHPHPASRDYRIRSAATSVNSESYEVAWVGELFADAYWPALPALFDSAKRTIEVCMFHAVAGGAEHPTRKILEALIRAHKRGVGVRVLLDRDNPHDPYKSTLINASARHLLKEGGVSVREDAGNRLLHSKYQVIDSKLAVVGSHNWSEGSYFEFDDLSVAIQSSEYATALRKRFDRLWDNASP